MHSSHICLACRRRLSQIQPRAALQWQARASFISLSNRAPRTTTDEEPADNLWKPGCEAGARKNKPSGRVEDWKQISKRPNSNNPGDVLESLFEESLKPPSPATQTPSQPFTVLEPYKNVDALRKLLSEGGNVADAWYFFVEHFGPDARKDPFDKRTSPTYLTTAARELIKQVIHAKNKDPLSQSLPDITEVSKVYFQLGLLHGSEWGSMVFNLLENILKLKQQPSRDHAVEERFIMDLLGAWNVVCRLTGDLEGLPMAGSPALDWSHIPSLSTRDIIQVNRKRGSQMSFGLLVPSFEARHLSRIPFVTAATFNLLTNQHTENRANYNFSPLINTMARIIGIPGLDLGQVSIAKQGAATTVVSEYVTTEWPGMKQRASKLFHSQGSKEQPRVPRPPHASVRMDASFITRRLHDSLIRRDGRQVDKLWAEASHWPITRARDTDYYHSGNIRGTLSPELCNYFILVYMGLRQPNRAIDVWNHMVENSLFPSIATWDSMLSGCKVSKDWKALEEIWSRMHTLKVQPDAVCWTTRISGLIESFRVDSAIRALDEMGRLWLTAAKKQHVDMQLEDLLRVNDVEGAVKPTIVTINAAVSGLLRRQQPEAAQRVLAWAGKFGISPDIITYNTLLRPLIREGNSAAAMKIFQQMEKAGVQADVATFTTMLDETFRHADQHTPEEQKEIIDSIFHEMEAAGVEANLHTYGKIIYGLLQNPLGDMSVVNTIIERMAKQGLQPSTHIYTNLLFYYFDKQPPDLDAVRSLIERARMEVGSIDHKFWDRVVEGYARAGETTSAVRILREVTSTHNKVSWLTLGELLTALAENEEWDIARSIVRNAVVDTGGPLPDNERGKEGQHRFWRLARELQLLDGA